MVEQTFWADYCNSESQFAKLGFNWLSNLYQKYSNVTEMTSLYFQSFSCNVKYFILCFPYFLITIRFNCLNWIFLSLRIKELEGQKVLSLAETGLGVFTAPIYTLHTCPRVCTQKAALKSRIRPSPQLDFNELVDPPENWDEVGTVGPCQHPDEVARSGAGTPPVPLDCIGQMSTFAKSSRDVDWCDGPANRCGRVRVTDLTEMSRIESKVASQWVWIGSQQLNIRAFSHVGNETSKDRKHAGLPGGFLATWSSSSSSSRVSFLSNW